MYIEASFHFVSTMPGVEDIFGDWTAEKLLQEFPILASLVTALGSERNWAENRWRPSWKAHFGVIYHRDGNAIFLDMEAPFKLICIPPLLINLDDIPTLRQVEHHILASMMVGRKNPAIEEFDSLEENPGPVLM